MQMMTIVSAILGSLLGGLVGFYGVIYVYLAWNKLTNPQYDPTMDYAAAWVGIYGAAVCSVLGAILGFCVARSRP